LVVQGSRSSEVDFPLQIGFVKQFQLYNQDVVWMLQQWSAAEAGAPVAQHWSIKFGYIWFVGAVGPFYSPNPTADGGSGSTDEDSASSEQQRRERQERLLRRQRDRDMALDAFGAGRPSAAAPSNLTLMQTACAWLKSYSNKVHTRFFLLSRLFAH
jgi:hypothetical protein